MKRFYSWNHQNSCIKDDFSLHSDSQKRLRQLYLIMYIHHNSDVKIEEPHCTVLRCLSMNTSSFLVTAGTRDHPDTGLDPGQSGAELSSVSRFWVNCGHFLMYCNYVITIWRAAAAKIFAPPAPAAPRHGHRAPRTKCQKKAIGRDRGDSCFWSL